MEYGSYENMAAPLPERAANAAAVSSPAPAKKASEKKPLEVVMHTLFLLCGILAVGFVLVISIYLIVSGVPAIRQIGLWDFLTGQVWEPAATTREPSFGILPFILTSVYGTAGAILIGVSVDCSTALFLSKVAPPKVAKVNSWGGRAAGGIRRWYTVLVGIDVLCPPFKEPFPSVSGACLLRRLWWWQ